MGKYHVLRQFDFYQPGDVMSAEDVADQERRGNMPDLLAKGRIAYVTAAAGPSLDLQSLTVAKLKAMAKAVDIPGYSKMKKAELIEALSHA